MPFVGDASLTACWLLPDESHPLATLARARLATDTAVVPRIWWYEIRNILIMCARRGRLDAARSNRALGILSRLPIEIDGQADAQGVLDIARSHD